MKGKRLQRWLGPCVLPALLVLAAGLAPAAPSNGEEDCLDTVLVILPDGEELVVELAVTPPQRSRGLMFRDELPAGQGMLLVFPDTGFRSIWMKNVRFPLDLLWLDSAGRVVHVEQKVPPCPEEPCPDYHSLQKAASVLELNAGAVEKWGIEPGDRLEFIPSLP